MEHTLHLGMVDYTGNGRANNLVTIEIELRERAGDYRTIDLENVSSYTELSIVGNVWEASKRDIYSGGQNYEEIESLFPCNKAVQEIVRIWKRWHLNGKNAGTRGQRDLIDAFFANSRHDYDHACAELKRADLLIDNGYHYGTAWLVEPLPDSVIERVRQICLQWPYHGRVS